MFQISFGGRNVIISDISNASMKLKKIMAKYTHILKFISIAQFSQMHLIFEINISKEL